ncbi:hypothetical protein, partial [Leptospira bandrabouensis]|uniref:hypothetical protein n=2 Tax=Leptospiraceae TaxID=170 RepID=UPI00223D5879
GIFYSDFPGNKKMNALRNQKLFKKSKLGIDIYTYFSQKKFALYFLKKTDEFISNFTNNINNLLLKKRIEEFLNSKT